MSEMDLDYKQDKDWWLEEYPRRILKLNVELRELKQERDEARAEVEKLDTLRADCQVMAEFIQTAPVCMSTKHPILIVARKYSEVK